MGPLVTRTRSSGATSICSSRPSRVKEMRLTVVDRCPSAQARSVMWQRVWTVTPRSWSQAVGGRTMESYWL